MTWFLPALICVAGWGCADLFYKISSDGDDPYSHLKIAVWVGLVMGVCAFGLMPFAESGVSVGGLLRNTVKYAPASLSYILSMVIGYAGLRYLELSIVSPVQNASGALSAVCMLLYFLAAGDRDALLGTFSPLDLIGTASIVVGIIALAIVEQRLSRPTLAAESDRRYTHGALALLFPLLYCVFDTVGTAADGIILDGEHGLGLGEIDVIILYGLTFFAVGVGAWIFLLWRTRHAYNPFARRERPKALAACCEEFGQVFYVYAMASKPVLAAPTVASYCIVSVLLSRVFLKEKLHPAQTACVIAVILGILCLGIAEGLAEA